MIEIRGIWRRLLGRWPRAASPSEETATRAYAVRGHGHLPPSWAGESHPRPFMFGRDSLHDYVETNTRYARSVLERIEGGRP